MTSIGDTLAYMPTVQRGLVGKGVKFRNAFAVNPLCCPSRASILTGLYSHSNRGLLGRDSGEYGGMRVFDDRFDVAGLARQRRVREHAGGQVHAGLRSVGRVAHVCASRLGPLACVLWWAEVLWLQGVGRVWRIHMPTVRNLPSIRQMSSRRKQFDSFAERGVRSFSIWRRSRPMGSARSAPCRLPAMSMHSRAIHTRSGRA